MIELENGIKAKDFRESINKNFKELNDTVNDIIK